MIKESPQYPGLGSPCNGCGLCCLAEQCPVSIRLFGDAPVCPALEHENGRYWCGLMADPGKYEIESKMPRMMGIAPASMATAFRAVMGAGVGCDSDGSEELSVTLASSIQN